MASILSEIHGQNIIHQDINSRNILVSSKGETVHICDFGIASRIEGQMDIKARPEKILGTLPYISPEQTGRLDQLVDERTDLYSLGEVLYKLMTSQLPFSAEFPMELIHATLSRIKLPVEKVQMYNLLIILHALKAEYEKARDVGKHALELLDFRLPEDNMRQLPFIQFINPSIGKKHALMEDNDPDIIFI